MVIELPRLNPKKKMFQGISYGFKSLVISIFKVIVLQVFFAYL
ncbi:hypothetical protein AJ81_06620 [Pseudothermotoga hypogea DSM 11164 = NBRC 106472]|uniref:Uncharacterized protein n=1 Tax=Pseudothermotoga hypogea DSM 11164 = NBRC 106472 TaxID=1123384 RepID=A0A0X1KU57_9THEM|nr:hypothetical protein AJ81_06620 [Pseudothermotoga hypogea DSM 11164 = NBRC 106472]